jgi:hypothetical protein
MDRRELFEFLSSVTEDERTNNLKMSSFWRLVLCTFTSLSLAWGTAMNYLIFRHFRKMKIFDKPINFLILVDQIIHQTFGTVFCFSVMSAVAFEMTLNQLLNEYFATNFNCHTFCTLYMYMAMFSVVFSNTGNASIAIYRLIIVKLNRKANERILLPLICFSGLAMTSLVAGLAANGHPENANIFQTCSGRSIKFWVRFSPKEVSDLYGFFHLMKFLISMVFFL